MMSAQTTISDMTRPRPDCFAVFRAHALNHILVAEDEEEYREDVAERLHEIQAADERIAPLGKIREDAEKSAVDLPRENRYRDEEAADEEECAYRVRVGDATMTAVLRSTPVVRLMRLPAAVNCDERMPT